MFGPGRQVTWDLGIDPGLDTNPGIMSYFFYPVNLWKLPHNQKILKAVGKCTGKSAKAPRTLKVFDILALGGGH